MDYNLKPSWGYNPRDYTLKPSWGYILWYNKEFDQTQGWCKYYYYIGETLG